MKKILSILLVILTILSTYAVAVAVQPETQADDYHYYEGEYYPFQYIIENNEVTITSCDLNTRGAVEIPEEIDGYPVKHIGGGAFNYRQYVTSVTIPDTIETIGDSAFYFTNMQSVYLPDSIRSIERFAFDQCDAAYVSDHVVFVPYTLEGDTSYRSYALVYFGNHLIRNMSSGKCTFEIPEGTLCVAGESIFSTAFKAINIPASVVNIGDRAFLNCEANEAYTVSEDNLYYSADEHGVLYNKDKTVLISYPRANTATHFTVPETVKEIEPYAFNNCANLESVTVSEGVKSIGESAFYGCTSLVDIELPDSLREIGVFAFEETGYYLDANNWKNSILYIGNHLIKYDPENYPSDTTETEIKDGTVSIAEYAIPYFPNPLSIPESVRALGPSIFSYSITSETITISKNIEYIGDNVFYKTETIKRFEVDENNPYYSSDEYGVLFNKDKTVLISYPVASEITEYTIPASVKTIKYSAFSGCQNLRYVDFEEDSAMIILGNGAFSNCSSLEGITLPETLKEIGDSAFYSCTSLKNITIPENVMKVRGYVFNNCESLETVEFAENSNLRYLGSAVFESCKVLKEIVLPEGVKKIRSYLFRFCSKLESVTIKAADLVCIENDAFHYNDSLKAVIFYGTEEQWANVEISNIRNGSLKQQYIVCDPDNNGFTYTFIYKNKKYIRKFKYGETVVIPEEIDIYSVRSWSGDPIPETMPRRNLTSTATSLRTTSKSENYDVSAYFDSSAFSSSNVSLSVAEIEGEREPGGVYMVDGKYYTQIGLYNIKTLDKYSRPVQPNEGYKVTIRLAIPEAYKNQTRFVIYHRFTSGGREQLSTDNGTLKVDNGYLIFEVSQFSEFELFVPVSYIKITTPPVKTVYAYGEELDLAGIGVVYTNSNGEKKVVTNTKHLSVSGYDSRKTGTQTVTVNYGNCSATFEVTVRYTFWQWIIRILTFGLFKF